MAVPRYPAPAVPEAMIAREDMQPKDRYDTADLDESQFEPGSRRRVLKNLLGIASKREMDQLEGREQVRSLEELSAFYDKDHRFTASDVCRIHQVWLGRIYSWAGHYRQVNLKKGEFPFAAAAQIQKLMTDFESGSLRGHTPCRFTSIDRLAASLSEVHVELASPIRSGEGTEELLEFWLCSWGCRRGCLLSCSTSYPAGNGTSTLLRCRQGLIAITIP